MSKMRRLFSVVFVIFATGLTVCTSHDNCHSERPSGSGITWKELCEAQEKDCEDITGKPKCVPYTCDSIVPQNKTLTFHEKCKKENKQKCVSTESGPKCVSSCDSVDYETSDTWLKKCETEGKECQDRPEKEAECIYTCRALHKGKPWEQYCKEQDKECDPTTLPSCRETCKSSSKPDPRKTWQQYCEEKKYNCTELKLTAECKATCSSPQIIDKPSGIWAHVCFGEDRYCIETETGPECKDKKTPCIFNYCKNGGTCVVTGNYTYKCSCPPHYSGKHCESYSACSVSGLTCGTKAKCQDMDNTAVCDCNDNSTVYDYLTEKCEVFSNVASCELTGCIEKGQICGQDGLCICDTKKYYQLENGTCIEKKCQFPYLSWCEQICSDDPETQAANCSCEDSFTSVNKFFCLVKEENKCKKPKDCINGDCADDVCYCERGFSKGKDGLCTELDCSLCQSKRCFIDRRRGTSCSCGTGDLLDDGGSCTDPCLSEVSREQCRKESGMCVVNWNTGLGFHCEDPCLLIRDQCRQKMQMCSVDANGKSQCVCPPGLIKTQDDGCRFDKGYSEEVYIAKLRFRMSRTVLAPSQFGNVKIHLHNAMLVAYGQNIYSKIEIFDTDCFRLGDLDHSCKVALYFKKEATGEVGRLKLHCEERKLKELPEYCLYGTVLFHQKSLDDFEKFSIDNVCPENTQLIEGWNGPKCACDERHYTVGLKQIQGLEIEFCEEINACKMFPCDENEMCVYENKKPVCRCIEGYDRKSSDKCAPWCSPANKYNCCYEGTCVNESGRIYCRCYGGWEGLYCSERIPNQHTTVLVLGLVLGVVSLLALIFGGIIFRNWRRSKN